MSDDKEPSQEPKGIWKQQIERACPSGTMGTGLVWDDDAKKKVLQLAAANPQITPAHIAAILGVGRTTVQKLLAQNPDIVDEIFVGRARGDNNIAIKNYSMAMKGDTRAMDREMKKRGMIGMDAIPVIATAPKRDYSKLSVEELEMLESIDAKTRGDGPRLLPSPEGAE